MLLLKDFFVFASVMSLNDLNDFEDNRRADRAEFNGWPGSRSSQTGEQPPLRPFH